MRRRWRRRRPAGIPAIGLAAVASLRGLLESLEELQVGNARAQGWSWQQIADALRVSRQAVHKKYRRFGLVRGRRDVRTVHRARPARSSCWRRSRRPRAATTGSAPSTCCSRCTRCRTTWRSSVLDGVSVPTGRTSRPTWSSARRAGGPVVATPRRWPRWASTSTRCAAQVEEAFGPGALDRTRAADGRRVLGGHIPFDREAKKALELALREALRAAAQLHRHASTSCSACCTARAAAGEVLARTRAAAGRRRG